MGDPGGKQNKRAAARQKRSAMNPFLNNISVFFIIIQRRPREKDMNLKSKLYARKEIS